MDDIEPRERVKKWLEYCDDNNIKPWEFDFKHVDGEDWLANGENSSFADCIIKGDVAEYDTSNLRLEIAYKSDYYHENSKDKHVEILPCAKGDCDKKASPMYDVLDWQKSEVLGPDTMNSFQTTLTFLIHDSSPFSENNKQVWSKDLFKDPIPDLYAELVTWGKTDKVIENLKIFINSHYKNDEGSATVFLSELETFAGLTHSIGNFTILPYQINKMRAFSKKDYWDLTLKDVHEFLLGINQQDTGLKRKIAQLYPHLLDMDNKQGSAIWDQFIEKYYLQPYVDEDYIPQELWEGHFENGQEPKKIEDFEQFYHNVNLLIIERGKWITKKLYEKVHSREELNECSLYQTELANLELHYFEEATTQTQKN